MIKDFIVSLTAACLCIYNDVPSEQSSVTIEITGFKNNNGHVLVSIFNNEGDFPDNAQKAAGKAQAKISGGVAVVNFKNLKPGKYAAAVLHDANDNLEMDFNIVGMPKEGYGFSNNAKGLFGPPSFSKAAFEIDKGIKNIKIKVNYLL